MKRLEPVFLLLGGLLFLVLLRQFGIGSLWHSLERQGPRFLWVLVPTAISYLLFCSAWWLVLDREARRELSFGYLFLVSIAGFSLNYLTPFISLGGEPLKMLLLSRRLGRHRAVSSVVTYNVLHVLSHVFVFLCAFVAGFWLLRLNPFRAVALAGCAALFAVIAGVILSCHERGAVEGLFRLIRRLPGVRRHEPRLHHWEERLGRYDDSVTAFYRTRRGSFWLALGADFAGRAIWALEIWVMLANVGKWLDPMRCFFVHSVSSLMNVATFFVPYELGGKEGGLYLCLNWVGQDPTLGVYVGVVSRLREILWILAGLGMMAALSARRPAPVAQEAE